MWKTATGCTVLKCGIVQICVRPVCLGDLQFDNAQTFSLLFEKVGTIPIVEGPACSIWKTPVLLTSKPTFLVSVTESWHGFHESKWPESSM